MEKKKYKHKCKSKKAEMDGMGVILIAFVAIVVGIAFYQAIIQYVGESTGVSLIRTINSTITMPAANGVVELTGQEYVGTAIVTNASEVGTIVPTTNYTITERINSDGVKGIVLTSKGGMWATGSVNITYTYYPDGYIDDAGGRSMALLIPIFAALAIAIVALVPALRSGIMDMMKS